MNKIKFALALAATAFISRSAFAADAGYFSKFTAPGQTLFGLLGTEVAVGTTPFRPDTLTSAGFSTDSLKGPVIVMSSNTQRIGFTITNISTRVYNNPSGDIRIYVGTSAVTTGWSTSTINQGDSDLRFSSNAFPVPLPTSFVLGIFSTTTVLGGQESYSLATSSAITNPAFTGQDIPPYIVKNSFVWPPNFLNTYVGDIYAVAVGTFGAGAVTNPGRVRTTQIQP